MPLLNKQKFNKKPIPDDLDPEQEVFYSKLTQEIFLDYEEFFERTILCNSLVWTCVLTGKTSLTYAEALESEQKARKSMTAFPFVLEKTIVYLINLTKRGNIKDLIDDLFSYTKDRYFIGETLQLMGQKNQTCKIIDILIPQSALMEQQQQQSSSFDEPIDVEMEQTNQSNGKKTQQSNGLLIDASKIKYLVESESKLNGQSTRQTVKCNQLSRFKNQLTKDKIYIIIKMNCEVLASQWLLTDRAKSRFHLKDIKFSELFKGDPPRFVTTYGRGQFSRNSLNNSKLNKSSNNNASSKQQLNNSKLNKSAPNINSSRSKKQSQRSRKTSDAKLSQIMNKKICDMTNEEFTIWRSHKTDEDLHEVELIESEIDKVSKKEERDKERERQKVEKNKQKEFLKELKRPKEDFECENLVDLPKAVPIQSKISQEMFGDSVMILEFLNYFGDLFQLKEDFPAGFSFELLENALFSKSCDSALCNLLLFYLDSVFKCYDEETFDTEAANTEGDTEPKEEDLDYLSDDEEISLEQLYKDPIKTINDRESYSSLAENYSKLIKSIQGRSFKNIGLDGHTITEMIRLYFLTSGSSHHLKTKFWYQQRGGYTRMDEIGIDFSLNEKNILKKLEIMSVYELEPEDKLKILTNLCHQLMSQVRFRDLIEDDWQKLTKLKAQLRDLQHEESRRLREETSERWKKKLQDRAREKARLEEIKTNVLQPKSKENTKNLDEIEAAKLLQNSTKKRDDFIRKEKHLLEEINQLQSKCCMSSLGKDRYYRRYWVLNTMPGIFVEDDNNYEELNSILSNETIAEIKKEHLDSKNESNGETNGKENKPYLNGNLNGSQNKTINSNGIKKSYGYNKYETKWSFYSTQNAIEILLENLNERGVRESELKQNLMDIKDKIFENLNKTSIIKNLTLTKEEIETSIQSSLKENMNNVLVNIINNISLKQNRHVIKKANNALTSAPNFATTSSKEHLEMELRTKLLDILEQISAGGLGHLKVTDRVKWKEALEQKSSYDPQCVNISWGGDSTKLATEYTIDLNAYNDFKFNENTESITGHLKTVNNLSKALLQIEQALEKRFLRTPIGDCQKTPEKRRKPKTATHGLDINENSNDSTSSNNNRYQILHNWEKSLMNCTNLSQVFIHLQSLDESIAWSKSVLNAKCKVCKRKCDAEKMILCDKCDRGHHFYCLRPALLEIPKTEWFCPECKPKDAEKKPRKIRKSFANNKDLYSDEEDSKNEEEDEEKMDEDDAEEEEETQSDDSAAKVNKPRKGRSKKVETESENESDEEEEEENEEITVDEDEEPNEDIEEEENEENDDEEEEEDNDDEDDEDYKQNAKSKIKLNGFKKKKVIISDEEINIDEDSVDEDSTSKRGRKRKIIVKKETKPIKSESKLKPGRNSRTRLKQDYTEFSEDVSGTDDDSRANTKRLKTQKNSLPITDTSSRNTELNHRLKVIEKLLNDLIKHTDGWPFLKPVQKRDVITVYYKLL